MLKLPLGWEVRHESGYTWYQNLFTKESTWEPPPGSILPPAQPSPLVADYGDYEEPPHAAPAASAPVVPVDPAPAAEFEYESMRSTPAADTAASETATAAPGGAQVTLRRLRMEKKRRAGDEAAVPPLHDASDVPRKRRRGDNREAQPDKVFVTGATLADVTDNALTNFFKDCGVVRSVWRPRGNAAANASLARARGRDELEHMNEPKRGAAVLTFGSAYAARLAIEKSGQRLGGGALIEVRASVRRKGAL